jgi:hypothetical protein
MLSPRQIVLPLMVLLASAGPASAQDASGSRLDTSAFPAGFDQAIYKGLVGNVLDAVPMDRLKRLDLQRTNAIVGNTLLGRSLTVLAGLSNPLLLLGGFAWGVWAASNIKAAAIIHPANTLEADGGATGRSVTLAPAGPLLRVEGESGETVTEGITHGPISAEDAGALALSRPRVVKIWLSQSSFVQPR